MSITNKMIVSNKISKGDKKMQLLFEMDEKDYNPNGRAFVRPSSRVIIIKNNKIYMIHSLTYNYYTFPGGGIEKDETKIDALIREIKEEAGLIVIKDSIKPLDMFIELKNLIKMTLTTLFKTIIIYVMLKRIRLYKN